MDHALAEQYENLLPELRTLLESQDFLERHRQRAQDFTRQRSLPFGVVIFPLINLLKRSRQDELDELFRLFSGADGAERGVTKSAVRQARQKVKHPAFSDLNQTQIKHFYEHFAHQRWQGRR